MEGNFPDPAQLSNEVSQELSQFILKSMNPLQENRFKTMKEFSDNIPISSGNISSNKFEKISCLRRILNYFK